MLKKQLPTQPRIFKMKKTIITLNIFIFGFLLLAKSFAATTITPTDTNILQKISNEIASKTAALNLIEKRGIIGNVTDFSDTQITLSDLNNNTRFIDVDELTKFSSPNSDSFGISDIKKGMTLGILGLYNKQSRRILARDVNVLTLPNKIIYGAISQIDSTNFEVTIVKENGAKVVAEVEDITKTYSYSLGELSKSGFSKITTPQTGIIIGISDKQDPNKIIASSILVFPDISINPKISLSIQAEQSIVPSTGSGKKLTPIVK